MSVSQMQELTGLSNATCIAAVRELEEASLISAERAPGRSTQYTLSYASEKTSLVQDGTSEEIKQVEAPTSELFSQVPIKKVHTQKKELKKESKEILHQQKSKDRRLITDYYQGLFVEEYQAKPTWDGRILKLVDADIARLGSDLLGELIQSFFEYPPPFVKEKQTGKGYNVFHSQIDTLLERRSRRAG